MPNVKGDGTFVVERLEDGRLLFKSAPAHKLILKAAGPALWLLAAIVVCFLVLVIP